jgi:hypothetical protein
VQWLHCSGGAWHVQFEFFRLSLIEKPQRSLFEGRLSSNREEFLRAALMKDFGFPGLKGMKYVYTHVPMGDVDNFILARVGRTRSMRENESPELDFVPVERPSWQAAHLILDPRHHADGQKLAIEKRYEVGSTKSIAEALANYLNAIDPHSPFLVEVRDIVDPSTFWDFAEAHRGEVVFVNFELLAPNMFGIRGMIDKEMKEFQKNEGAQKVNLALESQDGLNLHTERVKETVNYTAEGGGTIRARAKNKKTYNSRNKRKKLEAPEEYVTLLADKRDSSQKEQRSALRSLADWVLK